MSLITYITWSYQGSATFEVEMEDTDDVGTNFYNVGTASDRSFVVPLSAGDHYQFRGRAD